METLRPGEWNETCADREGERLDHALPRLYPELSRSRAQKLIDAGNVKVNGGPAKSNLRLSPGHRIEVFLPEPRPLGLKAESIPLEILFQDEHLAVVEKPAGLVVHPGAGHWEGTLVNALLHHFGDLSTGSGIGGELRPGIVHRIDRNTSGILLITKTDLAHRDLSLQFKEHTISRRYTGLCWGKLPLSGEWDDPIARDPKERKRMAVVEGGRKALTRYSLKKLFTGPLSLFEAELFTGRTHQIRVHFSAHGFPLAGDAVYGHVNRSGRKAREEGLRLLERRCPEAAAALKKLAEGGRQFLHAAQLGFRHPATGRDLCFESPLPSDLQEIVLALEACGK